MSLDVLTTPDGAEALGALRGLVLGAKGLDPLSPVTVVVPTNSVGVLARRHLGRSGGIAAVQFLTIYRLAELLGGPTLAAASKRPVSTPVMTAAVQRVLAEQPGHFAPVHRHEATLAAVVRGTRELRGIEAAAVHHLGRAGSPLTSDLVRVHDQVRAQLAGQWYDEADLMDAAAAAVGPELADRLGPVIVHLPLRLTSAAVRLLQRLAAHLPVHIVLPACDDALADQVGGRVADQLGLALPPAVRSSVAGQVEQVSVSDADEEVREALRQITDAARRGTPLERMAVLWCAPVPYQRLVGEQLTAAGVAWNGPSPIRLAEHLAGRTLLGLLELDRFGLRRSDLFGLLGNAPVRDRSGHNVPTAAWERVSRAAGVGRGDDWGPRLAEYAARQRIDAQRRAQSGDDAAPVRLHREADLADQLAGFVAWLVEELGTIASTRSWHAWSHWAHRMLRLLLGGDSVRARFPAVERAAFERVESVLDRLAQLDDLARGPDRSVFRSAVASGLDAELLRSGRIGDGVLAGSLSSAIGLDTDLTIILGLAEGTLPAPPATDPLLSEADRRLAGPLLRLAPDQLAEQRRSLVAALRSSPRIVACVPRGDLRQSCRRSPSRWLLELIATEQVQRREVHSYTAGVVGAEFPATPAEHRIRELLAHVRSGAALDAHHLAASDHALRRGLTLRRARELPVLTAYDGDLSGLPVPSPFDPQVAVAPTRLEAWVECPHRYLLQYVLRVPEPDDRDQQIRISPLDRGNVLHATLDRFLSAVISGQLPSRAPGEPWSVEHHRAAQGYLAEACAEAEAAGLTGRALLWQRDRALLELELTSWLFHDDLERASRELTPVASERTFGRPDGEWPAPEVILPSGRSVRFVGSIDRLDRSADGSYLVTDHKTGSSTRFDKIRPGDEFVGGSKLQLAVYAAAVGAATGTGPIGVTAEYAFTRTHRRRGYTVGPDVWGHFTATLDIIATAIDSGLFPQRPGPPVFTPWVPCHFCDPDGLGTGEAHRRWQMKQADPRLADYLVLVGERDLNEGGGDEVGS